MATSSATHTNSSLSDEISLDGMEKKSEPSDLDLYDGTADSGPQSIDDSVPATGKSNHQQQDFHYSDKVARTAAIFAAIITAGMFTATIVGLCIVVWQQQVTISELQHINGRVDRLEIQCNCTDTAVVDRDQGNRPDNELSAGDLLGSISEQLSNVKSEVRESRMMCLPSNKCKKRT